ncbi:MAG: hypothetical protein R3F29_00095 [Planctomycetota bacterium]
MNNLSIAVVLGAVLALAGSASAQHVIVAQRADTPLVASTIVGGVPYANVLAAGPLPSEGTLLVASPQSPANPLLGRAWFHWSVIPSWTVQLEEWWVDCSFSGQLNTAGGAALASLGDHELVFDVTAVAPRKVFVDVDVTGNVAGASQPPVWEVDVGDDGVVDAQLGGGHVQVPLQLGATAVPIRLRCNVAIGTPNPTSPTQASMSGSVSMRIRPDNDLAVQQVAAGCGGGALDCEAVFASNGVQMTCVNTGPLTVLVLGTQSQPWTFTDWFGTCEVVPSFDVLLTPVGALSVPIPASVRPFTFYAQALYLAFWYSDQTIGVTPAQQISAW